MRISPSLLAVACLAATAHSRLIMYLPLNETSGTQATDYSGNNRHGRYVNGPALQGANGARLDGVDDYIQLPNDLMRNQYSISASIEVNLRSEQQNYYFIFGIGNTGSNGYGNGYIFVTGDPELRAAITPNTYENEAEIRTSSPLARNQWVTISFIIESSAGRIGLWRDGVYLSGRTNNDNIAAPGVIGTGSTQANYIGRSVFRNDKYLAGSVRNFRLYDHALSNNEAQALGPPQLGPAPGDNSIEDRVTLALIMLSVPGLGDVRGNINLPTTSNGVPISWASSDPDIVSERGVVNRPLGEDVVVELKARAFLSGASGERSFWAVESDIICQKEQRGILWDLSHKLVLFDAYTVHGRSIDSGYASALASDQQKSGLGSHTTILESVEAAEIEPDGAEAVYSDEGSVTGAELEGYKSDLVNDLVGHIRGLGADTELLGLILHQLPSLIRSFALKLGQPGSMKSQRDVMYFLHKYRHDISKRVETTMVELVEEEGDPEPEPVDGGIVSSRVSNWLETLECPEAEGHSLAEGQPHSGNSHDLAEPDGEEPEEVVLPDRFGYRHALFKSEAYKALLTRISCQLSLTAPTESDAMVQIRSTILSALLRDSTANYSIRSSLLRSAGKEFTLEKVSLSLGQIVTGACQFSVGRKDSPVHISKDGYIAMLQWLDQLYVVLWDEEEKRGWLVNGPGALLHLLRASLEHCGRDKFSGEFLFKSADFQEPMVRYRHDSALSALMNRSNRRLHLYEKEEKCVEETVQWPDGRRETVKKISTSYMTLEDKTMELCDILEKLVDHEAQSEASAKGLNVKPSLNCHVQGWDFCDIITKRDPLYLQVATIPSSGGHWVDFAKSIRAVTLFGRGFGDLIKPLPTSAQWQQSWSTMPTGVGSLAACMADLRDIIDRDGDRGTKPLTLSRGIVWHNPSRSNPFEGRGHGSPWIDVVQELHSLDSPFQSLIPRMKSSTGVDVDACEHGALIFGRSKSSQFWSSKLSSAISIAKDSFGTPSSELTGGTQTTTSSESSSCSPLPLASSLPNSSGETETQTTVTEPLTPSPVQIESGESASGGGERSSQKRDAANMEGNDQQLETGLHVPGRSKRVKTTIKLAFSRSRGGGSGTA
ncbi:hypothetical protein B0T14DRAFT_606748 [Immersiella caudata]|uniref:Atrophied bacterial Ig domain-containing protein n=1 Tax=Immersiella caudata TaxID=314043 RepID=A0AA39WFJ5_9PEZI|nr:hypothetical protein B0T14DRAFT_606748 [Immersiella caudata]